MNPEQLTNLAAEWSELRGQIKIIINNNDYAFAMNHPEKFNIKPKQILLFFNENQIKKARRLCPYGGWLQIEISAPMQGINNSLTIDINLTTNAVKCYCCEYGPAPYYVFTEREVNWILQNALQTKYFERIPKEFKEEMKYFNKLKI